MRESLKRQSKFLQTTGQQRVIPTGAFLTFQVVLFQSRNLINGTMMREEFRACVSNVQYVEFARYRTQTER